VIDGHKRLDAYRTVVSGREADIRPTAARVNAISFAAELIEEIDRIAATLASHEINNRFEPPFSTLQVGTIKAEPRPTSCRIPANFIGKCVVFPTPSQTSY
jgi:acetylornithine deacetylase